MSSGDRKVNRLTDNELEEIATTLRYMMNVIGKSIGDMNVSDLENFSERIKRTDLSVETWGEIYERALAGSFNVNNVVVVSKSPPPEALYLLDLFLSKSDRQAIPGDLEEEFITQILPKYGPRRARWWFWAETVKTITARNRITRCVLVGSLVRLGEWIFRQIGS